ncbi:Ubiquitin-like-conjugating enzyme ATG10 [Yarrowia sp. C11]|nr:Ubiquitin-like-conjugating enzyme ATG10 [Yarrowia sp. E02]KAG5367721.1 Ubiquitin-like-conjugating enzyme ATG10 [Yarrowia sp. C11]
MEGFEQLQDGWRDDCHVRWRDQNLQITRIGPAHQTAIYDIIWSQIYACPVVYMSCYRDSDPVTLLDDFVTFMAELNVSITPDIAITQGEHPHTGLPVFFLHPCKTRETVDILMQDEEMKGKSEAEVWMESYGRVVGLERRVSK